MRYKDFVKNTGYGTGGGLCGWNCRHTFIPFNPETMTNSLKQYDLEENKEMYENHQKQRYFEKNVRKYKRLSKATKTALENAKNYEKSKLERKYRKYKYLSSKWNKAYKAFSKRNDLKTHRNRTKV